VMHYFSCSDGTGTDSIKMRWDTDAELVFSHFVGPAGHVVHSGVSEARNGGTLFFMLG
jgi:hypothetical protein